MSLKIPLTILHSSLTPKPSITFQWSACLPFFLLPSITTQLRTYASAPQKKPKDQRKRPQRTHFIQYDLSQAEQLSLVDAMRYLRASEVGQKPTRTKYELAVKLVAQKNGPTIKSSVRLPKPVKTDVRICVFAEGKAAEDAKKAGAHIVGTNEIWEQIKNKKIDFDKCLCHENVYPAMMKAKIAPILGPRGLLPNPKTGTVVKNPASAVKDMTGQIEYRERLGVVRTAIGQLGFTEKELQKNIVTFMTSLKKDIGALQHKTEKSIVEVVLSSTRGPGISLNGEVKSAPGVTANKSEPVMAAS